MGKRNFYVMKKLEEKIQKCELCDSSYGIEVHHIVPIALGGEDSEENMIVLCRRCHARLTPTKTLTKAALKIRRDINIKQHEFGEDMKEAFHILVKMVEDKQQFSFQGYDICGAHDKLVDILLDQTITIIGHKKGDKLITKKSINAKEIIRKCSKDFNGNLSDVEVMELAGVARGTYYKYKRELKAEKKEELP